MDTKDDESAWRITVRYLVNIVLALSVVGAVAFIGYPKVVGGQAMTVLTGSMEPTISPGDAVIVVPYDEGEDPAVGDVITFLPKPDDPTTVTHRVIGVSTGETKTWTTQGDANGKVDDPIERKQIVGQVRHTIPKMGLVSRAITDYRDTIGVALIAALVAYALAMFFLPDRKRPQDDPEQEHDSEPVTETSTV